MAQIDLAKTLNLVRGGLTDHENTWADYFKQCPSWKDTAIALTLPLILVNVLFSTIFSRFSGGFVAWAAGHGFITTLLIGLVMALAGVFIMSLVFNLLAGVFSGKSDFSRAFAGVSLAMIPSFLAGIIAALIPWVGFLIALAGGITSLVFLYKIMPLALEIPQEKRALHYVAAIVLVIVAQVLLGMILRVGQVNPAPGGGFPGSTSDSTLSTKSSGFVGELERQGRLYEAAQTAEFSPPDDGELSSDQVSRFSRVISKTEALQRKYAQDMQALADRVKDKEESGDSPSVSDLGQLYTGMGSAVGANNAEMEIVVTGGGNWAEHQWVKEQIRIARIQQGDGPEPIPHNYELYLEFKDELPDSYQ